MSHSPFKARRRMLRMETAPGRSQVLKRIKMSSVFVHADGMLIVSIREARLKGTVEEDAAPRLGPPTSYANVFLDPDPSADDYNQRKTQLAFRSHSPVWNQTFKFFIPLDAARETRLHVAVWTRQEGGDQYAGGLSFALETLTHVQVSGWYALLPRDEAVTTNTKLRMHSEVAASRHSSMSSRATSKVEWKAGQPCKVLAEAEQAVYETAHVEQVHPERGVAIVSSKGAAALVRREVRLAELAPLRASVSSSHSSDMPLSASDNDESGDSNHARYRSGSLSYGGETDVDEDGFEDGEDAVFVDDLEDVTPKEQQRQEAIQALFATLQDLTDSLRSCIDVFADPLNFDLTSEQHSRLFGNIEELHGACKDVITTLATRTIEETGRFGPVSDALKAFVTTSGPKFMVYAVNRDASKQELRRLNSSSPDFTAFLEQQAETFPGSNLHDLLTLPVRVLPTLPKQMEEVLRHTPETHPDHLTLTEVREQMQQQVQKIQRQTTQMRAVSQLSFYEEHMTTQDHRPLPFKLMEPTRFLVAEETLPVEFARRTLLRNKKSKPRPVTLILFNDFLLLTEKQQGNGTEPTFILLNPGNKPLFLKDIFVDADGGSNSVYFGVKSHSFVLHAKTAQKREQWHKLLTTKHKPPRSSSSSASSRPAWLPNGRAIEPASLPLRDVVLPSSSDLGFSLRTDSPAVIAEVRVGSAAERAGLHDTDAIVRINHIPVAGLSHEGVLELLRSVQGHEVQLTVQQHLRRVTVLKDAHRGFGFVLQGNMPTYIKSIDPDGAAERAGLRLGDHVWEINGAYVRNKPHEAVVDVLRRCSQGVKLLVRPTLRRLVVRGNQAGRASFPGFALVQKGRSPLHVSDVDEDGPASACGLQLGDQVWEMNGRNVREQTKATAEAIITRTRGQDAPCLRLVVISTLRHVHINGTPLGLKIAGERPPHVESVDRGGNAAQAGVRSGDVVWAVNGRCALGMTHAQAVSAIRSRPHRVVLSVPLQ